MAEEHRRKIENEAKSWLQIQTHKSALEIGAGIKIKISIFFIRIPFYLFSGHWRRRVSIPKQERISLKRNFFFSINNLSNDMKNFLEYTYQIVRKSLERYLYQVQQKDSVKQEEQKIQEINKQKRQDELTGGKKLRSILRDTKTNSRKLPMIDGWYQI
jgi:hypothetical protein